MGTAMYVALGLGLANFVFAAAGEQNWALAIDRTWFQLTACFAVGLAHELGLAT